MEFRLRKKRIPGLHRQLAASGWFQSGDGPYGGCPVQLFGRLHTGECVYFRARGDSVSLEISSADDPDCDHPHRVFKETMIVDHELGTGVLPTPQVVLLIQKWLTEYLGAQPAERKRSKMNRFAQWWSSIEDKQLLGVQFSFAATGGFGLSASYKKDMFHNGENPVRGASLRVGPLVLHISSAGSWN